MKKQLLALSLLFAINPVCADVDTTTFYDETNEKAQWEFIEKAFITTIQDAKKYFWRHLEAVVPATFAALGTCGAGYVLTHDEAAKTIKADQTTDGLFYWKNPKVYLPGFAVVSNAILLYQYAQCYIANKANRDALQNFFENYEENQYFVPAELQYAFDLIADRIEEEGMQAVLADADDYVGVIEGIVMRHFESRYKSIFEAKGRDILAESKTVIENFKNIFDGATKFGK